MAKIQFENVSYQTYGELPTIGSRAPDVSLVNNRLQNVSLAQWPGMRKIMNIIVSIDMAVCAKSVIEFDRHGNSLDNVVMLMVSYDLPFAHARFQEQHHLEHVTSLSAIRHAGFGENYGVQIVDGPLAGMFSRAIVVLDENNTVVHNQHIDDIGKEPDYESAFRALGVNIDD